MRKRMLGVAMIATLTMGLLGASPAGAAAGDAKLNVVHGIPGVTVNVCVDGVKAIPDFMPGDVVKNVVLTAGMHDFKIVAQASGCGGAAILQANGVDLMADKNYTAIANLDEAGDPALSLFTNNVTKVASGNARLTVRHTAAAPAVNVWANGAPLIGGTDFTNGKSKTFVVPNGIYATWASLPGDYAPVIDPAVLNLKTGLAYQVYAWGNGTSGYNFAVVSLKVGSK